jgi:hypothetical protein
MLHVSGSKSIQIPTTALADQNCIAIECWYSSPEAATATVFNFG